MDISFMCMLVTNAWTEQGKSAELAILGRGRLRKSSISSTLIKRARPVRTHHTWPSYLHLIEGVQAW